MDKDLVLVLEVVSVLVEVSRVLHRLEVLHSLHRETGGLFLQGTALCLGGGHDVDVTLAVVAVGTIVAGNGVPGSLPLPCLSPPDRVTARITLAIMANSKQIASTGTMHRRIFRLFQTSVQPTSGT